MGIVSQVIAGMTAALLLCSCSPPNAVHSTGQVEIVMPAGSSITAPSNEGTFKITAVTQFERRYEWDKTSVTFAGGPRRRRWYGSLGITLGSQQSGTTAISNAVLEESQQHYHSEGAVIKTLASMNSGGGSHFKTYWTDDGLAVLFNVERVGPSFISLTASVTQYCVNGKKPKDIPGATPGLALRGAGGQRISTFPCVQVDESGYVDTWPKDRGFRE
jgi:hypothetical protein